MRSASYPLHVKYIIHNRNVYLYRIDGPHNKTVLAAIQAEMREHDENCSLSTIRGNAVLCACITFIL